MFNMHMPRANLQGRLLGFPLTPDIPFGLTRQVPMLTRKGTAMFALTHVAATTPLHTKASASVTATIAPGLLNGEARPLVSSASAAVEEEIERSG